VRRDEEGVLNPGWPATFVVWETPAGLHGVLPHLVEADPEATDADQPPLPTARLTVVRGETIFATASGK
jgi:predicted amidohydrolase YtcJ